MTRLVTRAFERAFQLPDDLQYRLAQESVEEIEGGSLWDSTLAGSRQNFEEMAQEAEQRYEQGKTKEIGFDGV